ncbi:hypothetical protein FMM05_01375 [Flavobacterium zepuense]|uniref:MoxR-vWA-beta-propeller ternary system domain-containing protein n=1 Tax=Flavobacterium zepuense TaxID=2593302 RepID=A0A552VA11_9FLAO|nr:hypothetical protein [Flavobacterium zepuense]TRW27318.1 hypothetical protein FMM05_01375 [Flavobacterium zepuense]
MEQPKQPFLETLYHLRTIEQVILYNKMAEIPASEATAAVDFLESEYEREATGYPYTAPKFDAAAALWGAKTLYNAAQLMVYRDTKSAELAALLPPFPGTPDASAMLSADICLRFLPQVAWQLHNIDAEDPLIAVLRQRLVQFHYSAIVFDVEIQDIAIEPLFKNDCFRQLYIDRVTERKAAKWAALPAIKEQVLANLGNHKALFWREIDLIN